MFKSNECAWAQVGIKLLGATITGLRGLEFKYTIEKEHLYAAGSKPIDLQSGNEKCEGNIKVLKYELDRLNDAAQAAGYANIAQVPHTLISITCSFKKDLAAPMKIVEAIGVGFTEAGVALEQNAKNTDVTLPFLAMDIVFRNA